MALGSVLSLSAPVHAESDPSVQSWRVIMPGPRSSEAPSQTYRARRRYDAPRARHADDSTLGLNLPDIAITIPLPPDAERTRIAVVGDSLAEALAFGMEADPALKAELLIRQKTVSASGLVREDYHDWPKTITTMIAENPSLAAVVIPIARPRSDIGETRALLTVNTATTLIGRQGQPLADPVTRDLFEHGTSPTPRVGRSDDYRWRWSLFERSGFRFA